MKFHSIIRQSARPKQPCQQPPLRFWEQRVQEVRLLVVDAFELILRQRGVGGSIHLVEPFEAPRNEIRFRFVLDGHVAAPLVGPGRNVHRLPRQLVYSGLPRHRGQPKARDRTDGRYADPNHFRVHRYYCFRALQGRAKRFDFHRHLHFVCFAAKPKSWSDRVNRTNVLAKCACDKHPEPRFSHDHDAVIYCSPGRDARHINPLRPTFELAVTLSARLESGWWPWLSGR